MGLDEHFIFPQAVGGDVPLEKNPASVEAHKNRRERIATAVMSGFATVEEAPVTLYPDLAAKAAVEWADALMAELDKNAQT